ncbi:MAG: rod shape-determining protein MreC [Candidatus Atribacteria bacterium]|nr:rod shape-determining protein MreC [Candidatus Atribacteria bacterium]
MIRFSKEKRAFLLFLGLLFISAFMITVDYHDKGFFGFAEDMGLLMLKPANQFLMHTGNRLMEYFQIIREIETVRQKNEQLSQENQMIKQENSIMKEKISAYDRLVKMMQFKEYYSYEMIGAQVVGREPNQWFHSVMIDKGDIHQVEVDMGVATYNGFVGKVIQVNHHTSKVLLLVDQGCSVGAMVQRSREIGVIKGGTEGTYCYLDYIAHDADVQINDIIVTSGMGSVVPKGIQIGYVVAIKKEKHDLFQRILVKPQVDFNQLEEVFIVKRPE